MHSMNLLHMLIRLVIHLYSPAPPNVECVATVQPAGVPIRVMWQLGRGISQVPVGLEYPRGGQLEMDRDPEGQARGYDMTSFQTVPCHIAGMVALSCWKRKLFPTV